MAEEVAVRGMDLRPKARSPWAPALLPVVTLGIYWFVWYYKINKEMASLGRSRGKNDELGDSPGTSLLAVTLGALVVVPAILSLIHTFQRIQRTQRLLGADEPLNGWLGLVLYCVISPAFFGYMQSGLNSAWHAGAGSGDPGQYGGGQFAGGGYQQHGGYPGQPQQVGGYPSGGYPAQPGYPAQSQQGGGYGGGYPVQQGQYPPTAPAGGPPQYPTSPGVSPQYPSGDYQGHTPSR